MADNQSTMVTVRDYRKFKRKLMAEGYKHDISKFMLKFMQETTEEFDVFLPIWKDMKMSLLFMGRENEKEMSDFAHECFAITLNLLTSQTSDMHVKVGCIYMLYSLYMKQPYRKHKIRLTIKEFDEIYRVWQYGEEKELPSLGYVILELIYKSAFSYVFYPALMGPDISTTRSGVIHDNHLMITVEDESWNKYVKEFWDEGRLQDFHIYDQNYKQLYAAYGMPDLKKQNSDTTNYTEIAVKLAEVTNKSEKDMFQVIKEYEAETGKDHKEAIGFRRAQLKDKQMSSLQQSRITKRAQTLQNTYHTTSNEEDSEKSSVPKKKIVKSRKQLDKTSKQTPNAKDLLQLGLVMEELPKKTKVRNQRSNSGGRINNEEDVDVCYDESFLYEENSRDAAEAEISSNDDEHPGMSHLQEFDMITPRAKKPIRKSAQRSMDLSQLRENEDADESDVAERIDQALVEGVSDGDSDYQPIKVKAAQEFIALPKKKFRKKICARTKKPRRQKVCNSILPDCTLEPVTIDQHIRQRKKIFKGKKLRHHYDTDSHNDEDDEAKNFYNDGFN